MKNDYKQNHMNTPIEKHDTAAWSNVKKMKPVSNVTIPNEDQVNNAKDYVDGNQK